MNHTILLRSLAAGLGLALIAAAAPAQTTTTATPAPAASGAPGTAAVSKKDRDFMMQAAGGGMYEVEAGRLAESRGQDPQVKSFGAMLVKDHGAANEELKALAAKKGVALPPGVPKDKQRKLDKLGKAKNFDKEFLDEVGLDDHKKDIGLFEKAGKNADDPEVRAFAAKTLPTLQMHREHAQMAKKQMKR